MEQPQCKRIPLIHLAQSILRKEKNKKNNTTEIIIELHTVACHKKTPARRDSAVRLLINLKRHLLEDHKSIYSLKDFKVEITV